MPTNDPHCLSGELEFQSVEFDVEIEDSEKLSQVEAGLHRLGCRTEASGQCLRVWLPAHPASEMLSSRELQLVCLASKGYTDKEIASMVGLSIYTVRSYWVRICNKLEANNRTHAVSLVFANEVQANDAPLSA